MASGRILAKVYAARVRQWIAERDALGDYGEYERSRRVDRSALCSELDFGRSVVAQNPAVRESLAVAEARWYAREAESPAAQRAARERAEARSGGLQRELDRTRDQVARLAAENSALRRRLARHEALEEILVETGRLPRT